MESADVGSDDECGLDNCGTGSWDHRDGVGEDKAFKKDFEGEVERMCPDKRSTESKVGEQQMPNGFKLGEKIGATILVRGDETEEGYVFPIMNET